jgi:hypothetical protein
MFIFYLFFQADAKIAAIQNALNSMSSVASVSASNLTSVQEQLLVKSNLLRNLEYERLSFLSGACQLFQRGIVELQLNFLLEKHRHREEHRFRCQGEYL